MPIIRDFQKKENILIFDSYLDEKFSTYDESHLEALAQFEEGHFWFENRRRKICEIFEKYVSKSSRILEVGGGTGFVSIKLKKLGFSIEMGDIHINGLHHAQKKGIEKLYQFDLFNPPFSEEFDVVCLFDVLEHLYDPTRALMCLKTMLKPGGMIILTMPAHQWLWSRADVIAGHHMRADRGALLQIFKETGFKPTETSYFFSAILPFLLLRRWIHKDSGLPLKENETVQLKINPLMNHLLNYATCFEFCLNEWIPNIGGGSILGVAQSL